MDYETTVRVLLQESRKPVANVRVELFDRDEHSEDDKLGAGVTNAFGEVTIKYETKHFADNPLGHDDGFRLIGKDTVPDLYAVVYDANGEVVVSKREEATENHAPLHILVLLDEETAARHQLKGS